MSKTLFSCFAAPRGSLQTGQAVETKSIAAVVQRVSSSAALARILRRARADGRLVVVEWAANWCSLCLEADLIFAQLAANLAQDGIKRVKLIRVNLDKAEDLAAEHKIIMLPSFSLFQNEELVEHYTGLESCKILETRLKSDSPLDNMLLSESAEDSQGSDQDNDTLSSGSPNSSSHSLQWNAFAPSPYIPRYSQEVIALEANELQRRFSQH